MSCLFNILNGSNLALRCGDVERLDNGQATAGLLLVLTLLGALVAGVLQRQADRTVVSCAIFPVGDDLPGRRTVSHCRKKRDRKRATGLSLDTDSFPYLVTTEK